MIICKECKFWKKHEDSKLGDCSCDKFKTGYGSSEINIPDDCVLVENDEGWAFYTGKDFGCVHFKRGV